MAKKQKAPSRGGQKTKQAFAKYWAGAPPGNGEKMVENERKRVVAKGIADAERDAEGAKKAKKAAAEAAAGVIHDELTCPMEVGRDKELIELTLKGMTAAVEMRHLIDKSQQQGSPDDEVIVVTNPRAPFDGGGGSVGGSEGRGKGT